MKIAEVLRDKPNTKNRSTSGKRILTCASLLKNDFFTSTPYFGFYPHMPAYSAGLFTPYTKYCNVNGSLGKLSTFAANQTSTFSSGSSLESTSKHSLSSETSFFGSNSTHSSTDRWPSSMKSANCSIQSDSGFFSSASSSGTPLTRNVVRGYKKTYCYVCKVHITKEGKRSQGPRRHLLQHHVRRPLFQCPHCPHSSFYDKFHVTSHMRRIHQDKSDRLINRTTEFESEIEEWYDRCFNDGKTTSNSENKENARKAVRPSREGSTPPPVLTPEPPKQENASENTVAVEKPITETPLKPPCKKYKMGFMIDDLLKTIVKQQQDESVERPVSA